MFRQLSHQLKSIGGPALPGWAPPIAPALESKTSWGCLHQGEHAIERRRLSTRTVRAQVLPANVLGEWHARSRQLHPLVQLHRQSEQYERLLELAPPWPRPWPASMLREAMAQGLHIAEDEVTAGLGRGVSAGLHTLGLGAGDAVAVLGANDPALALYLARRGATCTLQWSDPAGYRVMQAELEAWRSGSMAAIGLTGPGAQRRQPSARLVADRLAVAGPDALERLRPGSLRALVSLQCLGRVASSEEAARQLGAMAHCVAPGGGLVFSLPHAAGQPKHAVSGWRPTLLTFGDLAAAAGQAGLSLGGLHIEAKPNYDPFGPSIVHCEVPVAADGRVDLRDADAAAWSVWPEVFKNERLNGYPILVMASGVLRKGMS